MARSIVKPPSAAIIKKAERSYRKDVMDDARMMARIVGYENSSFKELADLQRQLTGSLQRLAGFLIWKQDPRKFHSHLNPWAVQ